MITLHLIFMEHSIACTHVEAFLMDLGYGWWLLYTCGGYFDDMALDLWCLLYDSQPSTLRSTSSTLIYGDCIHFGATCATWRVSWHIY
jgi:hypothetical protein